MSEERPSGPVERVVRRHTPGPWKWSRGVGEWELVGANHDRVLFRWEDAAGLRNATVVGDSFKPADAYLIQAAPELLTALIELRDWYEDHTGLPACAANAAISKALNMTPNAVLSGPHEGTSE